MRVLLERQRLQAALRHAREYFPDECSRLGPEELERAVRDALKRAGSYGLESLRDALQFVDLTLVLGPEFDSALPWAREILAERSGAASRFRSARLYLGAQRHLRRNA